MTFNSITFFAFLAIVLVVYWNLHGRSRNALVVVASFVFYGLWDWRFLSLLVISIVVDFTIGRLLDRTDDERRRKRLLLASMATNLGILGVFKYTNFFLDSFVQTAERIGFEPNVPLLQIVLPVGISFYTFQTMSYTIDVYRRRLEPVDDLLLFAAFVSYFPQLVAGPIERARVLLPQLADPPRRIDVDTVASAVGLILLGLFKKVVLADGVAAVADTAFDGPEGLSWLAVWAGVVAFAIQIYGDFSGYTDMARGVSRLLGIELTLNFTQPYLSRNITEFWRRWHISLSNWLRDYLYIPLGGNRRGVGRTYANLMITMLLGGLWHGASWNFVVWGGLHGLFLVVHRLVRGGRVSDEPISGRDLPAIVATTLSVWLVWIFFRAPDFATSRAVFAGLAGAEGAWSRGDLLLVAVAGVVMVGVDLVARRGVVTPTLAWNRPALAGALATVALLGVLTFSGGTPRPFVYFQF